MSKFRKYFVYLENNQKIAKDLGLVTEKEIPEGLNWNTLHNTGSTATGSYIYVLERNFNERM